MSEHIKEPPAAAPELYELTLPVNLTWPDGELEATTRALDGRGLEVLLSGAEPPPAGARVTARVSLTFGDQEVELPARVLGCDGGVLRLGWLASEQLVQGHFFGALSHCPDVQQGELGRRASFFEKHVRTARPRVPERLSVVVPLFNEQDVIQEFHKTLVSVLEGLSIPWEIVYVDDGSRDETPAALAGFADADRRIKQLSLSRNFGHQVALIAGLEASRGSCVVTMDGDLQHPPACIPELVDKWREGYDVVNTLRASTGGAGFIKNATSSAFYGLLDRISSLELPAGAADFRLMDRRVVEVLLSLPEQEPFLRGLVQWIGFDKAYVTYQASERQGGTSKFTMNKMVKLAGDALLSFSFTPLRLAFYIGFITLGLSLLIFTYALISWISGHYVAGWTSTVIILTFFSGMQLLVLGTMAEYIGRVFTEVKQRPRFLVKQTRRMVDPVFEMIGDRLEEQKRQEDDPAP